MNSLKMNLGLILSTFFGKGGGALALDLFEKRKDVASPQGLHKLLRNHETTDEPITDRETYQRDAFDTLLAGYAMLEIASMCGEVPKGLPQQITKPARSILKHPAVRDYYVDLYPTPLVEAFRRRLAKRPIASWNQFAEGTGFTCFFEHSRPLENEGALETFLWFLDDGERDWGDGYKDLDDTVRAVSSPQRFSKCVMKQADDDLVALSVQGLVEFIEFCRGFDDFLQSLKREDADGRLQLLRSAYWHFHSYWFVQLRDKVGSVVVGRILPQVISWREQVPAAVADGSEREWDSIARDIAATSKAISRLTSKTLYRAPLVEALSS